MGWNSHFALAQSCGMSALSSFCSHFCPPQIEITKLHEFAQAAFNGYKSLNLIQIHIFHTAYYTNENILVCAPTGAGKTNIALISILHEYGSISSILRFRWYEALVARTLRQGYCDIGMFIFKNVYQMSVTTYMLLLQFMVESTQTMIRIVGLSATLLNYLEYIGISEQNFTARIELQNEKCYKKVFESLRQAYQAMVFVHSRKDTTKTAQKLVYFYIPSYLCGFLFG
ncbi:unnamed protein product [Prunus armeniaca]